MTLTSSDHEIDKTVDVTNGSAVVPVTLDIAHAVTLTVTAGRHTATSGNITVAPGTAARLPLSPRARSPWAIRST